MERDDLQPLLDIRKPVGEKRLADLNELLYELKKAKAPITKTKLARVLDILPSKLTTLLSPESYRVALTDDLAQRISLLLNRSASYVSDFYASRTAA